MVDKQKVLIVWNLQSKSIDPLLYFLHDYIEA